MDFVDGNKDGDIIEYMNIEYFTLFSDMGYCLKEGLYLNKNSFDDLKTGDYLLIVNYNS